MMCKHISKIKTTNATQFTILALNHLKIGLL